MAFSSQSFKAPKIKKGNFSSPLSSGAVKASTSAPKLKATKISFIKKENSPIVEAVNNNAESLTQTNEILIEIQKQLAFDFANRIAEEKDSIKRIKEAESTRRFEEEEKSLEKTSKIGKRSSQIFGKVLTPVKGIFDKLVEFFGILGTGFVLNAAYKWLQNEGNREKVQSVIDFVTNNWKTLLGVFIGVKVFGFLYKLIRLGRLISSFFGGRGNRGNRGGGRGPSGPGGGFNPCSPVTRCLDKLKGKELENLANKILTTAAFTGFLAKAGLKANKDGEVKQNGMSWWKYVDWGLDIASIVASIVGIAAVVEPGSTGLGVANLVRLAGKYGVKLPKNLLKTKKPRLPAGTRRQINVTPGFKKPVKTNAGAGNRTPVKNPKPKIIDIPAETVDSILSSPAKTNSFLQYLRQSSAFRRGGSDPTNLRTLSDFAEFSNTTVDNLIRSQLKNFNKFIKNPVKPIKVQKTSSAGGSIGNIAMLTLPAVQGKPPQIPTPAETATETPYIDSVNSSNPYMQLTPDIYGIAA